MKKFILASIIYIVSSSFSFAQTTTSSFTEPQTYGANMVVDGNCYDLKYNLYKLNNVAQYGSYYQPNNDVYNLQLFLQGAGFFNGSTTGYFGDKTFNAVKKFQASVKITPTGYVGPLTRAKIKNCR